MCERVSSCMMDEAGWTPPSFSCVLSVLLQRGVHLHPLIQQTPPPHPHPHLLPPSVNQQAEWILMETMFPSIRQRPALSPVLHDTSRSCSRRSSSVVSSHSFTLHALCRVRGGGGHRGGYGRNTYRLHGGPVAAVAAAVCSPRFSLSPFLVHGLEETKGWSGTNRGSCLYPRPPRRRRQTCPCEVLLSGSLPPVPSSLPLPAPPTPPSVQMLLLQ